MTVSLLSTLSCFVVVSSFTPGPGNILAMNTTTRYGWQQGKRLVLGICCGYLFVQTLCTLMLYQLNALLAPALVALKYAGALYMLYLAVQMVRSHPVSNDASQPPRFATGFLLQLVNVKIYFYISTLLTIYLIPTIESLPLLLLAGVGITAVGSLASLSWALLGVSLQDTYRRYYRPINLCLGLFLVYCAWGCL